MSVTDARPFRPTQSTFFQQSASEGGKYKRPDCNGNLKLKFQVDRGYDPIKAEPAIQQLRNAVADCKLIDTSEEYLVKWLIVQDFDVDRAERMLRQSLEWRRVSGADDILDSYAPSDVLRQYFSMGHIGNDRFGCPVFVCCLGRMDIKGLLSSLTKKDFYNYLTWMFETFSKTIQEVNNKRTGYHTTRQTLVFDLDQFSMMNLTTKPAGAVMNGGGAIVAMIKYYLSNYPDSFRRIFVINAPSIFPWVFGFIKPLLAQSDVPKIKIFNSNKKEWTSALLEEIDDEQLPTYYGGNMTDPDGDPKCPRKLNMGGQVPHSFYLRKNPPIAKDYMETLNISAGVGGKKKLKFEVVVPHSAIRWEFMTDGGDIGFRILNKNAEEIVPLNRVDSHIIMEEGQVTCNEPGQYVFQFDNTYSYLRKKKVHYHIVVDLPDNTQ
ncbi:SEC14-like protein 2 [Daphnia pulicaria]|uniref:SEC14-like protein 2 n=1 Tax=Daphnia pulicaria TaxID=35523 RepID=UPI001EEA4AAD|nr:SEC14-like protein 2 [Daphnia pulicaria]